MQEDTKPTKANRMIRHILKLLQHFPEGGLTLEELLDEVEYDERKLRRDLDNITEVTEELGWEFLKPAPGRPVAGETKKYFLDVPFIPKFSDNQILLNLLMLERLGKRPLGYAATESEEQPVFLQYFLRCKLFSEYIEKMRNRVLFMEPEFQNMEDISGKLDVCMEALADERVLAFSYNARNRRVCPLGLVSKEERWYLRAFCCDANEQRTYRLDRITTIRRTDEKYTYPTDFSLQELTKNAWAVLFDNQGELITVRFLARGLAAEDLLNTSFHSSQKIEKLGDGSIKVTYRLDTWKGMVGWVLRWGQLIDILEPEELRNEIKGIAEEIVAKYSNPVIE